MHELLLFNKSSKCFVLWGMGRSLWEEMRARAGRIIVRRIIVWLYYVLFVFMRGKFGEVEQVRWFWVSDLVLWCLSMFLVLFCVPVPVDLAFCHGWF